MKSMLNKFFAIVPALLLVATVQSVQGQATANVDVTATAEVAANLTLDVADGLANVDFGLINQDVDVNSPTVDPADAGEDANLLDEGAAAKYLLAGSEGASVIFTFATATLEDSAQENSMTFTPDIRYTLGSQAGARGGDSALSSGSGVVLSGDSQMTLWIGGALSSGGTVPAGEYSGDLNVSVEYD